MTPFLKFATATTSLIVLSLGTAFADDHKAVGDEAISKQRAALAASTKDAGFGPQSPRDIDAVEGANDRSFEAAPPHTEMNLCNIHFHEGAEHKGGEFTTYAGNGNGEGHGSGYLYDGELSDAEKAPIDYAVGNEKTGTLRPGDTIEIHYVHSTAQVKPGATLGACLSEAIVNPQLRVEAQVYVLVNDDAALDLNKMTALSEKNGYQQAENMPTNLGDPVQYDGSTTGPGYNEKGSPLQVSWSVHPEVAKVSIKSVAEWLKDNAFDEDHAHGVRNLVKNPDLLSKIEASAN